MAIKDVKIHVQYMPGFHSCDLYIQVVVDVAHRNAGLANFTFTNEKVGVFHHGKLEKVDVMPLVKVE